METARQEEVALPSLPSVALPPPQPPIPRRHDVLAVGALILISCLFFGDVLIGKSNFYLRDLTRYYYPTKKAMRNIVHSGEFPYWNTLFSAGQPMAANPEHELFYPLTWLVFLPDYDLGYRLHILVHIWIGLAAMYALLRSMGLRIPASFFGAASFGLGGTYLSYINLLPILFCAAWLPLTCLYVRRYLLMRRRRDFALASLSLGIQFLVAEPTTVMQTGFLIGMYALYRGWYAERRFRTMTVNVLIIAAMSVAAFSVGAAQMLPGIDHARDSVRARGFPFSLVQAWSMPWAKLAEMIYPNILGHISIDQRMWYWAGGNYPRMGSPFLFSIYPGLAVTALAIGGALIRPRGGRFVLLLAVFSVTLALGSNTPLLRLLFESGIATAVRYPEKFALIALFAVTLFAAQMFQRLLDGDTGLRDAAAGFALATAVVALAVVAMSYTKLGTDTFFRIWGMEKNKASLFMAGLAWMDWKVAAIRGLALLTLLLTVHTRKRLLWLAFAAVFLLADLLPVVHQLNPRMPRRFFTESPPIASTLAPERGDYRVFHDADWYGSSPIAVKYFSTGDAVYWLVRNGLFPMVTVGEGLALVLERDYDKTTLLPTVDLIDSMGDIRSAGRPDWAELMMSMSNGWYQAVYRNFENEKSRMKGDLKNATPIDFRKTARYPRYYFAQEMVTIRDRKEFVKRLTEKPYLPPVPRAFIHEPSFPPAPGRVLRQRETANDATIEVESSGRSFLVMSVTPHKYWRVYVDGKEVRSLVTNIGYQGIVVPKGTHVITMKYRNTLITWSVVISLSAVLILLVVARGPRGGVKDAHP